MEDAYLDNTHSASPDKDAQFLLRMSGGQPLGETLNSIDAITPKQLQAALETSVQTGLPVGWTLTAQGIINESLLGSAITAQRAIQNNVMTKEEARHSLRKSRLEQKDFRKILIEQDIDTKALDVEFLLAHLLVKSSLVNMSEPLAARELALLQNVPFETFIGEHGLLDDQSTAAVKIAFSQLISRAINIDECIQTLQKLHYQSTSAGEERPTQMELEDLIELSGLLPKEKLQGLTQKASKAQQSLSKTLLDDELFEAIVLDALMRSKRFIDAQLLPVRKALILISYCADNKCSLDEALRQFGWTVTCVPN